MPKLRIFRVSATTNDGREIREIVHGQSVEDVLEYIFHEVPNFPDCWRGVGPGMLTSVTVLDTTEGNYQYSDTTDGN